MEYKTKGEELEARLRYLLKQTADIFYAGRDISCVLPYVLWGWVSRQAATLGTGTIRNVILLYRNSL